MSCLTSPKIGIADVPGLSALLGDITIPLPSVSTDFCCQIEVQLGSIPIPIGSALGTMGATFEAVNTTIQTAINNVNSYLDQLTLDCPLD